MKAMKYDPESGYISHVENEEINRVARVCEEIDPEWQHERGRLLAASHEMLEALKYAAELIPVARQYFPKSIRHSDKFKLENTCATIGKAIHNAEGT